MIWYNKSWFQSSWFNLIYDRCQYMWQVTRRSQSQTQETHKQCRTIYQGQSLLPCLRRSIGLSTRLHRVSQSHQQARPLPQVQLPSPQRAPLRLRLLKSYVNVLACNTIMMLHFSGDIVIILSRFLFVCVCYCCPCWCFLRIDWCSSSYIRDEFGESPFLYTFRWVMTCVSMW